MGFFSNLFGGGGNTFDFNKVKDTVNRPLGFNSRWGNVTLRNGITNYTGNRNPNWNRRETIRMNQAQKRIGQAIASLPKQFDVNTMYDNPFFRTVQGQMYRSIDRQRDSDRRNLTEELNAGNQLGGAYAAYRKALQDEDYGHRYAEADDKARLASADAYNQSINNALNTVAGLQNFRTGSLQNYYYPLQMSAPFMGMGNDQSLGLGQIFAQMMAQQADNQTRRQGNMLGAISNLAGVFMGGRGAQSSVTP